MEEDAPNRVDYARWHDQLRAAGLTRIWRVKDTFAPDQEWSRNITHSAWQRGGLREGQLACEQWRVERKVARRYLECLAP